MLTKNVIESVDEYCKRLSKALHQLPTSEREDLIREVRSHILERVEARPEVTTEVLAKILREVGEPDNQASGLRPGMRGPLGRWLWLRHIFFVVKPFRRWQGC